MEKRDLTMMFKVLKNMAPNYLTILFRKCLPKQKTDFLKRSFSYRGTVAWNGLPSELLRVVDEPRSISSFRSLINNYYKTLYKLVYVVIF